MELNLLSYIQARIENFVLYFKSFYCLKGGSLQLPGTGLAVTQETDGIGGGEEKVNTQLVRVLQVRCDGRVQIKEKREAAAEGLERRDRWEDH